MTGRPYLRTHYLALAGHISVQQVRNYEASGLIPQAQRSPGSYRLYTQQHLAALQTVKSMARSTVSHPGESIRLTEYSPFGCRISAAWL